ncbi:universal stress protein [Streptomyces sp. H51]|uniref:universal stress protein n=1 Tax=Streptomyces sp. H51 TaxID=3111770 RepID=UPI002D76AC77|nr:universal stress protein [Streptomyces sp. H51]
MERMIVAGADASAAGCAAAYWAVREAELRGVPLHVVPVASADGPASVRALGDGAELVVVGLPPAAADTTAAALVERAKRPVVLVPGTPSKPGRVTVGLDAREPADVVLAFAFEAARLHRATLHAVHAWALPEEATGWLFTLAHDERATWEDQEVQRLSDALRPWRTRYPDVDVLQDVVLLAPEEALSHASGNAGLVVLGRRSGGTALALLRSVRCPVAVVPA